MVYFYSRDRLESERVGKQITKEHRPINNTEQRDKHCVKNRQVIFTETLESKPGTLFKVSNIS